VPRPKPDDSPPSTLVATEIDNQRPLQSKVTRLQIAIGVLILTILYTTLLIVL
jgi:hypothetical protein